MFYEIKPSEKPAIICSDGSGFTYSELLDEIRSLQEHLKGGKLAFCLCENSPASVIGYLACLNSHTVPLLLDKRIDRELLLHLLSVYHPDYIYLPKEPDTVSARILGGYGIGSERTNSDNKQALLEEPEAKLPSYEEIFSHHAYRLLSSKEAYGTALYKDLALLLTTSGSVGSPKLVRISHNNLQSNAASIAEYLELTADERPVTTLPMNYTYGLSIINSHLLVGATILMTDEPMNMKGFWDFMKSNKATSFGGVPYTYEMLKKIRFFKMDLPDLSYMTQAGGKLSPDLHREFAEWARDHGKKFIVMYGQTEATARMGYLPAEYSIEKYGSMGKAIPGGKLTLIDVDGSEITSPDTVGELIYEGSNVTLGYAESAEDLSKGDERNGRLATGDMAKLDADGFLYIVGRKKRFLKVFGNRVNLDELDQLVKANFKTDCASTGEDDHVKTYVTTKDITAEVRKWISERTHLSESAFEVFYIPEIPKNESGKVVYRNLG